MGDGRQWESMFKAKRVLLICCLYQREICSERAYSHPLLLYATPYDTKAKAIFLQVKDILVNITGIQTWRDGLVGMFITLY